MSRILGYPLASLLITVCLARPMFAQSGSVNHWETVVYSDDIWKYQIGTAEPGAAWKSSSYDDSGWLEGPGGIGYGDGDDGTIIDVSPSVYLRIKFEIVDIGAIAGSVLHIDYDDAFVAYLNNNEIARANM